MATRRLTIDGGITPIWRTLPAPPLPSWQALLTPVVANGFDELGVSVAVWLTGDYWHAIHHAKSVLRFEAELGVESRRWDYNTKMFARVRRERKPVRGEHAGLSDLFVPLTDEAGIRAILVTGPFSLSRPTSADLLARWHALAGARGRLNDPMFSDYVGATLETLTLDAGLYEPFERWISCFAELVCGRGDAASLAAEADALRTKVLGARFAESMWTAVREMVTEHGGRAWQSPDRARQLDLIGLNAVPEHVLVGLTAGSAPDSDALDDLLQRRDFQRACVALCTKLGGVACTQIGNHGIAFLVDHPSPASRARARLSDIASRASNLSRRFGLELHAGVSLAEQGATLAERYRAALWAAEKALSQGRALVRGEPRPARASKHLRELRRELASSIAEGASALSARFEQYAEAVLTHCGYRMGPARAQLDAALERVAEPVLSSGAIDEKAFDELCATVEEGADGAETVARLLDPYRRLFTEIEHAIASPTVARQDRGTRRATAFIRDHLNESLTLAQVARASGFAPGYFSRVFKRNEGLTFEQYAQRLRIERAMAMLGRTKLSIDGVRQLCGFSTRSYFHRVFRKTVGVTPLEFRRRSAKPARGRSYRSVHKKSH